MELWLCPTLASARAASSGAPWRHVQSQKIVYISYLQNFGSMALSRTGPHIQVKPTWSLSAVAFIRSLSLPQAPAEAWKLMEGHAKQILRVKDGRQSHREQYWLVGRRAKEEDRWQQYPHRPPSQAPGTAGDGQLGREERVDFAPDLETGGDRRM